MADKGFFSESGLTEGEAKEVHGYMTQFFMIFMAFAIVAHFLVWFWRPWIDTAVR
jgi:light-harvesting complex 1 beta chain